MKASIKLRINHPSEEYENQAFDSENTYISDARIFSLMLTAALSLFIVNQVNRKTSIVLQYKLIAVLKI